MAERRMFAKTIIDSDVFLDMPHSTQLLYFHLSMRADDDGFINNPKNIMRLASCKEDDLKLLIAKQFILPFESGIVVIKHWKIHNYIRSDRYKETKYLQEKAQLLLEENNSYKDLIQIVHYIVPRVVKRGFRDEDGNIIHNKFGYFKNSIISNINKLNQDIEDLWEDDDLYDNLFDR